MLRWKSSLKPAAAAATDYRSTILADSPVAYYRLGESSGTTASDETGSYDATYTNSPTLGGTGAISGDSNTSVSVATNQYAEIDSNLSITAYPFTIEAWVKTTATAEGVVGAFVVSTANNQMFALRVDASGYPYAYGRNTSGVLAEGTTAVNDGDWHHIVAVFAASNSRIIYVDGNAEDTHTLGITLPAINRFSIGRMGDSSPGAYFNGAIDEVAVYDTALSASTIASHYAAGSSAASGLTPTLVNSIGSTSTGQQSRTIDISSATEGAVMFLCWTHRSISSTNTPSGWTLLCQQDNGSHNWRPDTNVYYKTAGASESTVTLSCSNYEYMTAGVIEIVGADTSTLSFATRLGNVIPSVTQSAGGLVFAVHGTAAGSTDTAATTWTNSAYTELFDEWGNRSGTAVAWADFGAGATNGTDTATGWGGTDGAGNCCIQVAVDAV